MSPASLAKVAIATCPNVWVMPLLKAPAIVPSTPTPSPLAAKGIGEYLLAFLLVVVVAVAEETIFRGYLILRFRTVTASSALAVLLAAVVFSLGHGYEGTAGVVTVGTMGLVGVAINDSIVVLAALRGEAPVSIPGQEGMATVALAQAAATQLSSEGVSVRVVSMPNPGLFLQQDAAYREAVLPPDVKARVVVEAGVTAGWGAIAGDAGRVIGVDRFGASAPASTLFEHYGLTVENVSKAVRESLAAVGKSDH